MKQFILSVLVLLMGGVVFAQEDVQADVVTFRTEAPSPGAIELNAVSTNLFRPLYVTHAGDERLFIVEQRGRIYVRQPDGELGIFMDIVNRVSPEANSQRYTERGLLGLAFAPDYADSGTFYVNYTNPRGTTHVSRFQVSENNPNQADVSSEEIIFTQEQPFPNHNGGHMAFGLDGYLYVSLGDGGAAGDPLQAGQNPQTLLGSILRLDVDIDEGYIVPQDNPFVSGIEGAPEVWAYGVRNVWRFSFDRATGDMYFGDVGQNQWEEINFEAADSAGGLNYGWNAFEATQPFANNEASSEVVMPVAEYNHSMGCSVTGGYIYRGEAIPELVGTYLYSDYCSGNVWYAYRDENGDWQSDLFMETGMQVSSFGEDVNGELYIVNYGGSVHQIIPAQ